VREKKKRLSFLSVGECAHSCSTDSTSSLTL
jgi:hypothetical protein